MNSITAVLPRDPLEPDEPKLWKPPVLTALRVTQTPGGSLRPTSLTSTPRGTLKRKRELEQSIHVACIERAAACDLDEEEGCAAMKENYDHVSKWVRELPPPGSMGGQESCDHISGTVSVHTVDQPLVEPSGNHGSSQLTTDEHVDARPSTSGNTTPSRRLAVEPVAEGSDFDSEFVDEFNLEQIAASGGMARNIPDDDELDEPVRNIVNAIQREMDEVVDQLVTVSTDFNWEIDFDTFRGVPESFSGPSPGAIKDYNTPYEAFTDIWSRDVIEHIVRETNKYAKEVIDKRTEMGTLNETSRLRRWTETNVDEMYLYFAVCILMGLDARTSVYEYFKTSSYLEMPKFRQLLSYNRFLLLCKFIHFADNSDDSQDLAHSAGVVLSAKLRKITPVITHLNVIFQSLYNLHRDVVIDESLTLFKGRLSWVKAIRSKAGFGIKSYELCESRTGYLYKFEIFTGKNSECGDSVAPNVDLAGKSAQVVLDLLKGLEHRGHCVAMDNFYNCPALTRYLKSLGFDSLGTLRANRKYVPKEIAEAPKNVPKGTIIACHAGDVSCVAWKDTKMVNMISSYHNAETYVDRRAGGELVKPLVVKDYNNIMGGVDLKDQKLSMYLLERKRYLKWYMKIFRRLLNVSVHNALILLLSSLKRRNMAVMTHRDFREELANSLVAAHRLSPREISSSSPSPPAEEIRLRKDILHIPIHSDRARRTRCHVCLRKGIRKEIRLRCEPCEEYMCFGDCWRDWHSCQKLEGKTVHIRKRTRRQ